MAKGLKMRIDDYVQKLQSHKDSDWAWENFHSVILELINLLEPNQVLEVGGGRFPMISKSDIEAKRILYTSNDISEKELARAPDWVRKAVFDIQTADDTRLNGFKSQYDLIFSKMVMEHIDDHKQAYKNIHALLAEGGIAIAFHPVLYASPFVINKMLPEQTARRLLRFFFPDRHDEGVPKFPAYYHGCVVSERMRDEIKSLGFSKVWQVPFYGHNYYRNIPVLNKAEKSVANLIKSRDIPALAAFAFTIVQK